jgi:hypothetical protein
MVHFMVTPTNKCEMREHTSTERNLRMRCPNRRGALITEE